MRRKSIPTDQFKVLAQAGKALLLLAASGAGISPPARAEATELRLLIEQAPATLNPRAALDAYGQRIGSLIFAALTRLDPDLKPVPDLASKWEISADGKKWAFRIRDGLRDHAGVPITPEGIASCLEQYRIGKPPARIRSSFPHWIRTEASKGEVRVILEKPDPYLARNITLLRYFRVAGAQGPCSEPAAGDEVIGSGPLKPEKWDPVPQDGITLLPARPGARGIRIDFVSDEMTRVLKLLRGEADATLSSLTLSKTRWIGRAYPERIQTIERGGVNVSYLAFNLSDPLLARKEVRQAIALAIDRRAYVDHKMYGIGKLAGSLLAPELAESRFSDFAYDPERARKLLDRAGLKPDSHGVRARFRIKTTPVREGNEAALFFQESLRKIGIELTLDVVEPAVFLASVRKRAFQLFSSRWIGVADGSILYRTLRSGQPDNRAGYRDEEVDRLLDLASAEPDERKRAKLLGRVQEKMADDLPYFPLWTWSNTLVFRKERAGELAGLRLSLSGSLDPLVYTRP